MAVTYEVQTPERLQGRLASIEHHKQLADTVVWAGTIASQVAGKFRSAASALAGQTLLGVAEKTYTTPLGSDALYPFDAPAVFKRGVFGFPALAGNVPTDTDVGKNIAIADNWSVKQSIVANDISVLLVAIESPTLGAPSSPTGLVYFVEIK